MKKRLIKRIRENHKYIEPKYDFLKYMRICRLYTQKKHELTLNEFEILLFFYSEDMFTKYDAVKQISGMYNIGAAAFGRMIRRKLFVFYRNYGYGNGSMYVLSPLAKNIIKEFYAKLYGEEIFSEKDLNNPKFKAAPIYSAAYIRMAKSMNDELKEARITKR